MAFTEKDLLEQQQAVAELEDEFSRLNTQFESMVKEAGLSSEDLKKSLAEKLSPELQNAMAAAKEDAARAGEARAAQTGGSGQGKASSAAGRGRPGVIRL